MNKERMLDHSKYKMKNKAFDHSKYKDWIAPEAVKPYSCNSKIHTDKQIENIANSIRRFGWQQDTVLTTDNVLVIGHGRRLAALQLGCEMPYHVIDKTADELTEEDIRELRIADNQTNAETGFDFDLLAEDIEGLDFEGFDFDFGIDTEEQDEEPIEIVEDEPPTETETRCKAGDLWQLGSHRLICGNSTDVAVIDRLMDGVKADMWLSDPPYNAEIVGGNHAISAEERKKQGKLTIQNDKMSNDDFKDFLTNAFTTAWTILKEGASFYIWYTSREVVNFQRSLEYAGFLVKQELIWNKNSLVMGRQDYQQKHEPCLYGWKDGGSHNWYGDRKQTTVIDFERPSKSESHPTMKPIGLISQQIKNSSKQDDIVFDGFGGSGSTLIACEQLNRKCYMAELSPEYCNVILQRWENFTGQKAVLLNG